jgi:hypothetical protein
MFSSKDLFFTPAAGGYTVSKSLRFRSSASANLSRTFVNGNSKKYTFSAWIKRGTIGAIDQGIIWANSGGFASEQCGFLFTNDAIRFFNVVSGITNTNMITTQVFRDCSSWYHILFIFDSANATSTDRYQLWINGARVTAFSTATYPPLNQDTYLNLAFPHTMARSAQAASSYFDGYMAEVNFIDGQALTPSSFGAYDSNGVWQPARYTGSYGTTGFYLPFTNTTSTTTLVADSSGNGNNWTPNNISLTAGVTYDSMLDSPTNAAGDIGNYATLNPNVTTVSTTSTVTNGNLTLSGGNTNGTRCSSIAISSGKWYAEVVLTSNPSTSDPLVGIASVTNTVINYPGVSTDSYGLYCYPGTTFLQKVNNATFTNTNTATSTSGDIIGIAVDLDNNKIWFSKNGTFVDSGNPASGTNAQFTISAGTYYFAGRVSTSSGTCTVDFNFGQRPFAYTPPSGFVALNTQNLPTPTIKNGAQYMAATTYIGNGGSNPINNGSNTTIGTTFQPDFIWLKSRSVARDHRNMDAVRGFNNVLSSNLTAAEYAGSAIASVSATGFTLQNADAQNVLNETYIAWQWKAGGAPTVNNTAGAGNVPTAGSVLINGANSTSALAGSIAATRLSANVAAGFSVVTYTGTGANATVGHGLGVAPSMIIVKRRVDAPYSWPVYHSGLSGGANDYLILDGTQGKATNIVVWNNTNPTSTVFSIGTDAFINASTKTYVAYCFAPVAGYSAFGSYTGNGSTDGPFIFTGFRPRFVMTKRTDTTGPWQIIDTSRDTYNSSVAGLFPNTSGAEASFTQPNGIDYLSNGFKLRNSSTDDNASGGTYIYAAFCELPFKTSRAR